MAVISSFATSSYSMLWLILDTLKDSFFIDSIDSALFLFCLLLIRYSRAMFLGSWVLV